jgi:ketosteroid isomerase-like protein
MTAAPIRAQSLRPQQSRGPSAEKIELTFVDLTVQGDVAIVYYSTRRTMRADGTPVDERFEVTHTWVKENGEWKVLGGMGRSTPTR